MSNRIESEYPYPPRPAGHPRRDDPPVGSSGLTFEEMMLDLNACAAGSSSRGLEQPGPKGVRAKLVAIFLRKI